MQTITLKAHAKINPSLDVLAKRPDGYHDVRLIMQLIELHDLVILEWRKAPAGTAPDTENASLPFRIRLYCDDPSVPCDAHNLAWKAAAVLAAAMKEKGREVPRGELTIRIEKHIPMAAGLAGGSADGAAVLLGCNALWEAGFDLAELLAAGARLGADVPFAVMGAARVNEVLGMADDPLAAACALGEGTGTKITVLPPVDAHLLLVKPPIGVSTKDAYEGIDAILGYGAAGEASAAVPDPAAKRPDIDAVVLALNKHDLFSACSKMGNTLELYTLKRYHEVAYTKCKIQECIENGVALMSGSGPTVFLIAPEAEEVRRAYHALQGMDAQVILTRTIV